MEGFLLNFQTDFAFNLQIIPRWWYMEFAKPSPSKTPITDENRMKNQQALKTSRSMANEETLI